MAYPGSHPIIVLDGVDGAGKTTLSNVLAKHMGAKELHLTYRWPKAMHLYQWAALEYVLKEAERRPVILDRWWLSEEIYARVYRGGSPWPVLGRLLDRVALKHRFTYVLCHPRDKLGYIEHFEELKKKRVEMYSTTSLIWDEYEKWVGVRPDWINYDWTKFQKPGAIETKAQAIAEYAWDNKAGMDLLESDRKYRQLAGNCRDPKAILVGSIAEPRGSGKRKLWPFFEHNDYSLFITRALKQAGIPEGELMWWNARYGPNTVVPGGNSLPNLREMISEMLVRPRVIALGTDANQMLHKTGITVDEHIEHPSDVRRFRRSSSEQYGQILKDAIHGKS